MQEENSSSVLSVCPSFNSYSSDKLAEVAAKVSEGFIRESEANAGDLPAIESSKDEIEVEEEEFEFALVRPDPDAISLPTGEFFYDGQIRPIFPIFNRDLLLDDSHEIDHDREAGRNRTRTRDLSTIRVPLKKLFIEERDVDVPSSSSSESDELERIPPGTYCVWSPKAVEASPAGRCKKSNSTGSSSKRWRFRDLLRRSNSDGKDSFVFLTPSRTNTAKKKEEKFEKGENFKERRNSGESKVAGKVKANGVTGEKASAHEVFYVRNRAIKEGDKRRSYLPYRQVLVGFFANVNGLSKNFPPF